MCAHGGVDATMGAVLVHHDVMKGFAHAVQTLEFELLFILGHMQYGGDRMRVMGGELRIDPVGHVQQFARVGDIGHIGRGFLGEDGETFDTFDLCAFDLGVPVGAFHQADHYLAIMTDRHVIQRIDHHTSAGAIGLHHDAETIPTGQRRFGEHLFDDIQRQAQTVGFLGVDVQPHAGGFRQQGKRPQTRHQITHDGCFLRDLIARMQGRQLDRDAGVLAAVLVDAGRRDGRDRAAVAQVIAFGVAFGARGFAQHVIAIGIAFLFHALGAFHRGVDVLAQNKLASHFLHCAADGGADHRFAQTFDGCAQVAHGAGLVIVQHAAGQHQGPCGRVHQRRGGVPHMAAPVRGRDLVLDQRVDGLGVGHTQQRFGKAHQRDTFVGGQTVFGQKHFHDTGGGMAADIAHDLRRVLRDLDPFLWRQMRIAHQFTQNVVLVGVGACVNLVAQNRGRIACHEVLQLIIALE